jgi:hypothetical protein
VLFDIGMQSGAEDLNAVRVDGEADHGDEVRGDHVQFEAPGRIDGVTAGLAKIPDMERTKRFDRNMFISLVSDRFAALHDLLVGALLYEARQHPGPDLLSFRIVSCAIILTFCVLIITPREIDVNR